MVRKSMKKKRERGGIDEPRSAMAADQSTNLIVCPRQWQRANHREKNCAF
jgi:hypothetical protein